MAEKKTELFNLAGIQRLHYATSQQLICLKFGYNTSISVVVNHLQKNCEILTMNYGHSSSNSIRIIIIITLCLKKVSIFKLSVVKS